MSTKPLIGINTEFRAIKKDSPAYSYLAANYFDSVMAAGGVPVLIPPMENEDDLQVVLDRLDGVLFVGGADLDPRRDGFMMHPTVRLLDPRRETFDRLLPQFEQNPRIILSRLWEDARERILTGDVETFYTAPGRLELQLNRDPQIQQERQKQQIRSLKDAQSEFRR